MIIYFILDSGSLTKRRFTDLDVEVEAGVSQEKERKGIACSQVVVPGWRSSMCKVREARENTIHSTSIHYVSILWQDLHYVLVE